MPLFHSKIHFFCINIKLFLNKRSKHYFKVGTEDSLLRPMFNMNCTRVCPEDCGYGAWKVWDYKTLKFRHDETFTVQCRKYFCDN